MLGTVKIVSAKKVVSKHRDNDVCVTVEAYGIFRGGRRQHLLSFELTKDSVWITPLYSRIAIANRSRVSIDTFKQWIKSLPVVNSRVIPVDNLEIVKARAQAVDKPIAILKG